MTAADLTQEPPTGAVVAINWGRAHREVWVPNRSVESALDDPR